LGYAELEEDNWIRWKVEGCFNGYPFYKNSCLSKDDPEYAKIGELIFQNADPLGPNCKVGGMGDFYPRCIICDPGYVRQNYEDNRVRCIPITTQPEGCLWVNESGKCISCNDYEGYLPTDTESTSCYKFDPNKAF